MCHVRGLNTVAKAAATVVTRVHCRCFVASKNEKSPLLPSLSLSFSLDLRCSVFTLPGTFTWSKRGEPFGEKKKKFVRSDDYKKKTCGKRVSYGSYVPSIYLFTFCLYLFVLILPTCGVRLIYPFYPSLSSSSPNILRNRLHNYNTLSISISLLSNLFTSNCIIRVSSLSRGRN